MEQLFIDYLNKFEEKLKKFHLLYIRIRLYNIMFYMKRNAKGDREKAMKMLDRYIKYTHDGKMYGEWFRALLA